MKGQEVHECNWQWVFSCFHLLRQCNCVLKCNTIGLSSLCIATVLVQKVEFGKRAVGHETAYTGIQMDKYIFLTNLDLNNKHLNEKFPEFQMTAEFSYWFPWTCQVHLVNVAVLWTFWLPLVNSFYFVSTLNSSKSMLISILSNSDLNLIKV